MPDLIYNSSYQELTQTLLGWGEPAYRSQQIWQGLYRQYWSSPEQFSALPRPLRDKLALHYRFSSLSPLKVLQSSDGETIKTLFQLPDDKAIEAVLMTYDVRRTLCISTQAGCGMGCVFCATGQMGFKRHLTRGEIVEQVVYYARVLRSMNERVTNIVFMGMGEPFHNYTAVMDSVDILSDPQGMNLGERRFTISTVGLVPAIRQFTAEKRQVNLAISLHAANDELRSSLLPINRKYPLKELIQSCRDYVETTHRRVTFEYALISDTNDYPIHAQELGRLLKGLLCHVNIIPLNQTRKYSGQAASMPRVQSFKAELDRMGIPCTIRARRGIDISAGCGQLATDSSS